MKLNNKNIRNSLLKLMLLAVGLVSGNVVFAQEPVQEYMKLAGENNPELKATFNEYMAAMEQVPQVGALPDPTLAFGIFLQPVETRLGAQRFNTSVSQMFPWFGTLSAKKDVATQMAKAKYEAFEDVKLQLYRDVGTTYDELYYLDKAIDITRENLDILASFKELARVNFEGGRTGFVSVLRVEMEEQELRDKLSLLEDKKLPLKAKFASLLNTDLPDSIAFPDTLQVKTVMYEKETLVDSVLVNSPRLKKLEHEVEAMANQEEVAKKMGLPSFNLGVNYINIAPRTDMDLPDNGKDALVFPQVGISIPLYSGKYKAMRREASLKKEAASLRKEDMTNSLKTTVESLYQQYRDAMRRVELNANLSDISTRSRDLLQTQFTNGEMDFEEILRMERKVLNYRLEEARARVDLNNIVYSINYLMGK
ncbi:hypothetical protein C7S20_02940 [Christiangramia fulva]|uniref:TolC family protein n=1 Tax=Christiangramia fulva TaxID=2126553 RepID=A0A2R3Z226_9FLAO|nr:TolC family protein [Christiangramia fulva]AVR44295.1 hypothetical protein C7S20_02940 [Christiangramia fulva]